jgi:membrane-associated PAP2 superfamily phosphatase
MNRTGLYIALGLFAVVGLAFGFYPDLDLKLAALFYDAATKSFPTKNDAWAMFARDAAMWIAWAFVAPSIVALIVKLIWPNRPLLVKGRTVAFLMITIILSAGILTNLTFLAVQGVVGPHRRMRP